MSLIKCIECEHEVSSDAYDCPKCGAPISVKKNNAPKFILISLGIVFLIIGALTISMGFKMEKSYYFYSDIERYGGDAYTGIQNAAAKTANNVRTLGENMPINEWLGGSLLFSSGLILIIGGAVYKSKRV